MSPTYGLFDSHVNSLSNSKKIRSLLQEGPKVMECKNLFITVRGVGDWCLRR
jgi:hypothetical protein